MRKLLGLTVILACLFSVVGCTQGKSSPEAIPFVLGEPPELSVVLVSPKTEIEATKGTYNWNYRQEDGTATGVNICCEGAPERLQETISPVSLPATEKPLPAVLRFDGDAPDSISIRRWPLNDTHSLMVDWETVEVTAKDGDSSADEFQIELKDGDFIYEVTAQWNEGRPRWGRAWYHFHTAKQI